MRYCSFILRPKALSTLFFFAFFGAASFAQTSATSSPYSRFALGRPENTGFSEITALGGSYSAFRNDTSNTNTFFINQGNPASYAYNKFVIYEFGARYAYNTFSGSNGDVKKQNGGFNYISLSFPIRKKMGAAFGLVPFSNVGYEVTTTENIDSIGTVSNNYRGTGGVNQAYGGVAWRPFESRLKNMSRSRAFRILDSISKNTSDEIEKKNSMAVMRRKRFFANALSTLSVGSNVSFLYGTITYATRKYFPANLGAVYNTCDYTETALHDVYVQGGAQISFDINSSKRKTVTRIDTTCYNKKVQRIDRHPCCDGTGKTYYELKKIYGKNAEGKEEVIRVDTICYQKTDGGKIDKKPCCDSSGNTYYTLKKVYSKDRSWQPLRHKWRITAGYTISLPRSVSATATHAAYNFTQLSFNREIPFDTFSYQPNYHGTVQLPLMQSAGIGIKRGESLSMFVDGAYQQWSQFRFLGYNQGLKDQWRVSAGLQWQPDRMAMGGAAYLKRTFYRIGAHYNSGYLSLKGNPITEYAVSGGLGLPVGRYKVFTVVNLTAEYGMMGTTNNNLVQEKFLRFVVGLTFNDRWFIKPKYD